MRRPVSRLLLLTLLPMAALPLSGCLQDMWDNARLKPLEGNRFFADGRSARPIVAGTVARGELHADPLRYRGEENGNVAEHFPYPVTRARLDRGENRYDIYCATCHGRTGWGDGVVVQHGFPAPPSYHTARLRQVPVGHFFDVITNGYGVMYPYNDRVPPDDRWAIVMYIRALQAARLQATQPQDGAAR